MLGVHETAGSTKDAFGLDRINGSDARSKWQDTIDLLRLVQRDYQGARHQLEQATEALREKETEISQRLEYSVLMSTGCQTLRLAPRSTDSEGSQIGWVVLGEITKPYPTPSSIRLEVRCLGRFEVNSPWKQMERWQSTKAKSLFQFLVTRPRQPVIKDMLMETLWPDTEPRAANNSLKVAIHGVRQTLNHLFQEATGFPYILFLQGSYLINPEIELWVDVEEFEQHWELGRRLEREGRLGDAVWEFKLAETLYRGDYLEDDPYEEWALLRREALKDIYLAILGKLGDDSAVSADYESCIVYCQRILTKDPCREDAYRQLMRCYSRLGHRNRALRWYEICRQTIQAELDTAPDPETTLLYDQISNRESV